MVKTLQTRADSPDFVALQERFEKGMTSGQKAELRRAAQPEDLMMKPALYRLLQGRRPNKLYLRIAFLLPWVNHQLNAAHFSSQCAKAKINEVRMFQTARSDDPTDMIQLRRIAMQIKPYVDWNQFGKMLQYWPHTKRDFIENYYLAQYAKQDSTHENK